MISGYEVICKNLLYVNFCISRVLQFELRSSFMSKNYYDLEKIKQYSEEDLMQIIDNKNDYMEEVVNTAFDELVKKGYPAESLAEKIGFKKNKKQKNNEFLTGEIRAQKKNNIKVIEEETRRQAVYKNIQPVVNTNSIREENFKPGNLIIAALIIIFSAFGVIAKFGGYSPFNPCRDCGTVWFVSKYWAYDSKNVSHIYLCTSCDDKYPRKELSK